MPQRDLMVSSFFFAAYWMVGMVLVSAPTAASAVILTATAALAGVLWYFGTRWWVKKRP